MSQPPPISEKPSPPLPSTPKLAIAAKLATALLVVCLFAGLIATFLPAFGGRGHHRSQMKGNLQLRGIHQEMYIYAQNNGGYYPGLDEFGEPSDLTVAGRLFLLLDGNQLAPEDLINPADKNKRPWTGAGPFGEQHYSFAMLSIAEAGGRRAEWTEQSLNSQAIMASDRNTGTATAPTSVYNDTPGNWRGGVVYNDNHAEFATQPFVDTDYAGTQNLSDDLFTAAETDDALLIHTGE